jgi:hypothetical protein
MDRLEQLVNLGQGMPDSGDSLIGAAVRAMDWWAAQLQRQETGVARVSYLWVCPSAADRQIYELPVEEVQAGLGLARVIFNLAKVAYAGCYDEEVLRKVKEILETEV